MKKLIMLVALFAALGTTDTQAQYRQDQTIWGSNDNTIYSDERGEYRWEMRERKVWVPERRTAGVFGIGSRTIPGHYEMRTERVKSYLRNNNQGRKKQHPHGMPPGQRKKMEDQNERYESRRDEDRRYEDRRYEDHQYRRENDDRYHKQKNNKGGKKDKDDRD